MQNVFNKLQGMFAKDWWIEISTDLPHCLYYFGPFQSKTEAAQSEAGYVEDLKQEGAEIIQVTMMKCSSPEQLTVDYSSAFSKVGATKTE